MRNLFCHSNPVPRIGTTIAAALLSLAALTACGEAGALEPLDRWRDGEREIRTTAPAVTAGRTLLAAGDYGNFRLTGKPSRSPVPRRRCSSTPTASRATRWFSATAPSTGHARAVRSPPCATSTVRWPTTASGSASRSLCAAVTSSSASTPPKWSAIPNPNIPTAPRRTPGNC